MLETYKQFYESIQNKISKSFWKKELSCDLIYKRSPITEKQCLKCKKYGKYVMKKIKVKNLKTNFSKSFKTNF